MQTATAYVERVLPALDRAADRLTALLVSLPDPATPIPGSSWSVRDAAHVATVPRYADGPEGRGAWTADPRDLAASRPGRSAAPTCGSRPTRPPSCWSSTSAARSGRRSPAAAAPGLALTLAGRFHQP